MAMKKSNAVVDSITVLIHGTRSQAAIWYKPGSPFHRYVQSHGFSDVYSGRDYFRWRGAPTPAAREQGARDLIAWCRAHPAAKYRFIGHSHGANVANLATQKRLGNICTLIHLSPPAMVEYLPDLNYVSSGQFFTIHPEIDNIVAEVPGAEQDYQSYPSLRRHETVVLCARRNHWSSTFVSNWRRHDIARIVTQVCGDTGTTKAAVAAKTARGARQRKEA